MPEFGHSYVNDLALIDKMIPANCPLCGLVDSAVVFTEGRLHSPKRVKVMQYGKMDTVLCSKCGLLYRYPLKADELSAFYKATYYEAFKQETCAEGRANDLRIARRKNSQILQYIRSRVDLRQRRVLDLGCGRGTLLSLIHETCDTEFLLGVEPSFAVVEWVHKQHFRFEVWGGDIAGFANVRERQTVWSQPFDVVLLVGVLEHLADPVGDLKHIRGMIAEDGWLYMYAHDESPCLDWDFRQRISLAHVLYFRPQTMRRLLTRTGFTPIHLESRGTTMHVIARPGPSSTIHSNLSQDEFLKLYRRYVFSTSILARTFRSIKGCALIPYVFLRRIVKRALGSWLSASRA